MCDRPLHERLAGYADGHFLPMHMPGGKRRVGRYSHEDITEIEGFDTLHSPTGVIKDLENKLAGIWGAGEAFISVNGATAMIEAAVCAALKYHPDGKILVSSNSHLSVWHGIEMSGAMHVVTEPVCRAGVPFVMETDPESVELELKKDPDIKAVVITSPTYEGILSDTASIYEITKRHGCTLIVDCAHGAHLGTDSYWGPDMCGDLVIKSTHKTLSSPTQTAVMLKYSDRVSTEDIRHYIDIFESTSPSYLLMAGLSEMAELLNRPGCQDDWKNGIDVCVKMLGGLTNIRLFRSELSDPSKFVLLCKGKETAHILRNEYGIEVEAAFDTHLIAMSGIGDNEDTLRKFAEAVLAIDEDHIELRPEDTVLPVTYGHTSDITLGRAARLVRETIPADSSAGRICGQFIYSYPPGIPVLIPGDIISTDIADALQEKYGTGEISVITGI